MKSLVIMFYFPNPKYQDIRSFNPAVRKLLDRLREWALDHTVKEEIKFTAIFLNEK